MKSLFDKLNMRPQERRFVVIVGIIVFIVANIWFVIPHFGDLGRTQQKKRDADRTLAKFKAELSKKSEYERELTRLAESGQHLAPEQQPLEFQREVYQQAQQSGVVIQTSSDGARGGMQYQRTNSFFDEQTLVLRVITGEKELIGFLFGLGKGQSLTRVASMDLRRDPTQTKLAGNITLIKSFQKKAPTRTAAPAVLATVTPKAAASTTKAASPTTKPAPGTNAVAPNTNVLRKPLPSSTPAAKK